MVLGDVILRGTHAARPASGAVPIGTLYFETDTILLFRNNGTTWDSFSSNAVTGINQLTGDVTAGPGTISQVATIANSAVTYAKMQNVSATKRILGRKTAGAGVVEECTISDILDFLTSPAQGDILFRDASVWNLLAPGTSGLFLKTQGAGANPIWDTAGGGVQTLTMDFVSNAFCGLQTSPATLVAGVGSSVLVPISFSAFAYQPSGAGWTNGNTGFYLAYESSKGTIISGGTVGLGLASGGPLKGFGMTSITGNSLAIATLAGKGLQLVTLADITASSGGAATVRVTMSYIIQSSGLF